MNFKTKQITPEVSIIYGFKYPEDIEYSMVLTAQVQNDCTSLHGLLSKKSMDIFEFFSLWDFIKTSVTTQYITFAVLPSHAKVYKHWLPLEESSKSVTFDGFECEVLKVDINKNLKPT
jgi:hypothetical protein